MNKFSFSIIVFSLLITLISPTLFAEEAASKTPSQIPFSELKHFIDTYMDERIGQTTPGASIVIVSDNQVVHEKGYGFTSTANDTPIDASSTIFEWGSISKLLVWVSALQLVEQGKLDLEQPISHYLDKSEMPKLNYDEPITMLHLMNHTAGFEEYFLDLFSDSSQDLTPLPEFLHKNQPYQAYRPGDHVAYSNYSTSLAAYIIEKITNQTYEEYVKQHILTPLSMNDTIVTIANETDLAKIENKRATGYFLTPNGEFTEMGYSYISLYPSGSVNGTATDLAKFGKALLAQTDEDNILFNQLSTLQLLFTSSYSPSPTTPGIAHGFWEYQGTYKSFAHGGNTMGFSTNFHVVPEANFAAVILTNQVAEVDISYGLMEALLTDKSITHSSLPLDEQIDYNKSFITTRNTNHTFSKLYFYLSPLKLEANFEHNYLTASVAGVSAKYEQIGEHDFQLVSGPPLFYTMKNIHLDIQDTEVVNIYAPFAGYYATNISITFVIVSLSVMVVLFLLMLVMSIVFVVKNKKSKLPLNHYNFVILLQILLFINTVILMLRILADTNRMISELLLQIGISYTLGALTLVSLGYIMTQAIRKKNWNNTPFLLTIFAVILFQVIFMFWRFYSF